MNDEAALLARRVAVDVSAWMRHPEDAQVYARLVASVAVWDAYMAPRLVTADGDPELLDELDDQRSPESLAAIASHLPEALRARARRELYGGVPPAAADEA